MKQQKPILALSTTLREALDQLRAGSRFVVAMPDAESAKIVAERDPGNAVIAMTVAEFLKLEQEQRLAVESALVAQQYGAQIAFRS